MKGYPRLLPVTILATLMLLGVKVAEVWEGARAISLGTPVARAADPPKEAPKDAGKPGAATPGAMPAPTEPTEEAEEKSFTKAEVALLQDLSKRREELDRRSREIDMRESLLTAAEKRIDEKIAELKKIEAQIAEGLKKSDEETEKNLRSLVKVYENMKPKDAARIFASLEPTTLLGVVERMKEAKLAPILSEMDPKVAQQLTVDLANRRAIAPDKRPAATNG